jgi:hypothetical protein
LVVPYQELYRVENKGKPNPGSAPSAPLDPLARQVYNSATFHPLSVS